MKRNKKPLNNEFIKKWMNKGINPIILSIINRRGYNSENDLIDYFHPVLERLPSPFLFTGITDAFDRIDLAVSRNEKIIIYGDRDVDGTTSVAILIKFLKKLNADVEWDLPVNDEPYGLHKDKISGWTGKYSLCITVDCGITNIHEIEELKKNNIDTIIIDHHKPLEKVPDAVSIINPKYEPTFDFNDMSACGVVFLFIYGYLIYKNGIYNKRCGVIFTEDEKLHLDIYKNLIKEDSITFGNISEIKNNNCDKIYYFKENQNAMNEYEPIEINEKSFLKIIENISLKAGISLSLKLLENIKGLKFIVESYLPYAMLGTIADLMPMIKTNRIIAKLGINNIEKNDILVNLFNKMGIDCNLITTRDLSWGICPLLNASGRMGNARLTVEYLLEGNPELIDRMIENNNKRKIKGDEAYNNFINDIDANKNLYNSQIAFFYSDTIHRGVTGITATKLSSETNCPTIVAKVDGEYITGSIRGNNTDFHFVDFLDRAHNLLEEYGGHHQAAGFRLHRDNLEQFKEFLRTNSNLFFYEGGDEIVEIDAEIPFEYLNYDLFKVVNFFEPLGNKNESPVFFTPFLEITDCMKMGKEKQHLKFVFNTAPRTFTGVFWNKSNFFDQQFQDATNCIGKRFDVIYQVEINKYNGQYIPQMTINNMSISGERPI